MEKYFKDAFQKAKYEPEIGLKDKIWQKITLRNKRIAYFKLASFSSIGLASVVGFIPMVKILLNDFAQSGFYEYLSLAFSSNGMFSSYSKEFAYSLAESIPAMSIILVLVIIFVFFLSLKYVAKQIINNKHIGISYVGI